MNDYWDYIRHDGVIGMKWGVRRYRNEDGTLTEEGKRHYSKSPGVYGAGEKSAKGASTIINTLRSSKERRIKNKYDKDVSASKEKAAKEASEMSDEDLRKAITRLNMEQQYKNLISSRDVVQEGRSRAMDFLDTFGDVVAIAGGLATIATAAATIRNLRYQTKFG